MSSFSKSVKLSTFSEKNKKSFEIIIHNFSRHEFDKMIVYFFKDLVYFQVFSFFISFFDHSRMCVTCFYLWMDHKYFIHVFPTIIINLMRFYDWNSLKIWYLRCMLLSLVTHCILHVSNQLWEELFGRKWQSSSQLTILQCGQLTQSSPRWQRWNVLVKMRILSWVVLPTQTTYWYTFRRLRVFSISIVSSTAAKYNSATFHISSTSFLWIFSSSR